ncbi:hypothetical protein Pint_22583 [Pistacia integerrima]|uniref:Uncharacterized protein n=1 Tax=Pistacia integerrima TaxID=434235 RepID=A0ACC0YLL7_9ROSI|nr:hypothetical protein Pint_22583 [Pistacia integerrima]
MFVKNIPLPEYLGKRPFVSIFRSIDVNKPAPEIGETKGVVFCGSLRRVIPAGGLIWIGTTLDPTLTNADWSGSWPWGGSIPSQSFLQNAGRTSRKSRVTKLGRGETVKLSTHSSSIVAGVCHASADGGIVRLKVKSPVCTMQSKC